MCQPLFKDDNVSTRFITHSYQHVARALCNRITADEVIHRAICNAVTRAVIHIEVPSSRRRQIYISRRTAMAAFDNKIPVSFAYNRPHKFIETRHKSAIVSALRCIQLGDIQIQRNAGNLVVLISGDTQNVSALRHPSTSGCQRQRFFLGQVFTEHAIGKTMQLIADLAILVHRLVRSAPVCISFINFRTSASISVIFALMSGSLTS